MPDPAIERFFEERKEKWLKAKITPSMQDDEKNRKTLECEEEFSFEKWLPDAAQRACSRAITTHPCKFSHPSTGIGKKNHKNHTYVTPVISNSNRSPDGFLRTGNADGKIDSVGNAAELDVDEFLNLRMLDGETLLEHIRKESELARDLLAIQSESYQNLRDGFLAIASKNTNSITSSKIKQVYFPVDDGYHLLSILSNSGLIYELRHRVDELRFSEKQKKLRELKRNNEYSEQGFSEISNITTIGYGGTKPQNISVLNNQFGGKARLLLSAPPQLKKRNIQFARKNFFITAIRYHDIQEPLQKLHGIFTTGLDSVIPLKNLQSGRDHRVEEILDLIIERMTALRAVAAEQYREDSSNLPHYQKVWLCDEYREVREKQDEWLDELCIEIGRWIADAYKKVIKKAVILGPDERDYIKEMISIHREVLR